MRHRLTVPLTGFGQVAVDLQRIGTRVEAYALQLARYMTDSGEGKVLSVTLTPSDVILRHKTQKHRQKTASRI